MVEFRLASSEIRGRKRRKKEEEAVVKHKSADIYYMLGSLIEQICNTIHDD